MNAPAAEPQAVAQGRFAVLRHADFRIYWLGQAVSLVGTWMQQVAQSWVVVGLTDSKTAIAVISFVSSIPMLALSMTGGVLADRHDRRKILIATQVGFALLAFVYAALVGFGVLHMAHVYALAVALGVVTAFDLPAQQALVPDLVPRAEIPGAVALNQAIFHGSRLVGPALAGVLLALFSPASAFIANGLSFFAVIYSLTLIRTPPRAGGPRKPGGGGMGEGLRYIWTHREVRAIIGLAGLTTMLVFPLLIVFVAVFVRQVLGPEARNLGIVMSVSGLGALLGALYLLRVKPAARGAHMFVGCALMAASLAGISFSRNLVEMSALMLVLTFCVSMSLGTGTTMLQVAVPGELRGRVMGVYGMMWTGLMPTAALILGFVADAVGLRTTLLGMGIAYAGLALPWLLHAGLFRSGDA